MKLTKSDYDRIHTYGFSEDNPGYKPEVIESPNGDEKWDEKKKYAHIAPKYLTPHSVTADADEVWKVYNEARKESDRICEALDIPKEFWGGDDSTLRILDYPPGATTAPHTDFDLFTICLYRDDMKAFKYLSGSGDSLLYKARKISPGLHFGELMTEVNGATATKHEVLGTTNRQCSAVFFVVPDHKAKLPSGITVGEWMEERKSRSRKTK